MLLFDKPADARILALYEGARFDFPLIRAVVEQVQPGTIHVDSLSNPRHAVAVNRQGFAYCFGDEVDAEVARRIVSGLTNDTELCGRYILWYDPPSNCQTLLDALPNESAKRRTRIRYAFSSENFRKTQHSIADEISNETEVEPIDATIFGETEPFGLDLGSRFWSSTEDFLSKGLGIAVRSRGELASICYGAAVAGGLAEVDVATLEEHRGKGLAGIAAVAFFDRCLSEGVVPTWDCFDYNVASVHLAERLGFVETERYFFYSINT